MDIQDFIGISIIGAALSYVINYIKSEYGTESNQTKMLTIGLAVVVGILYYFIRSTSWYQTILGILAASSTVYAFFLRDSK